MRSLRRALFGLLGAGVALAGVMVGLVVTSDHETAKPLVAVLGPFIGLSFVATGVFAWLRRPHNRFGALMAMVGFAWFVAGLTEANDAAVYTVGAYLGPLYIVLVAHMLLAFPSGHLETTSARVLVVLGYVDVLVIQIPFFLLGGEIDGPAAAPDNAWALVEEPDSAKVFETFGEIVAAGLIIWLVVLLWRKRAEATPVQRRAMAPVMWTGLAFLAVLGISFVQDLAGGGEDGAAGVTLVLTLITFAALPYAFLIGLLRTRYSRAGAVGELIERLGEEGGDGASLHEALATALGDRSLEVAYWSRGLERYVDPDGRVVELPAAASRSRAATEIERDGQPVAAIIHDVALLDEPGLVRAAGAAAVLALENERLEAELKARVAELQTSRAKLIEVGMTERRALERNLHDGAQQRLVALSLQLGLARSKLREEPELAERILDVARTELAAALEELRELARGIHPAVLTDRGLAAALEVLAGRAPVPVALEAVPDQRLPLPVEAAAYFVVAESLTNIAKYADAEHATVRVHKENGYAVVEIKDDGVGGADPTGGTGLRGLVERVGALDGKLEVHSPRGEGTVVTARIPCA